MCDPHLVFAILEILTLLQRGTENEFVDEVRNVSHLPIHLTCLMALVV